MRFAPTLLFAAGLGLGLVRGHDHSHGGKDGEEKEIPLHERDFVKDSAEELERKWGFEVSLFLSSIRSGLLLRCLEFLFFMFCLRVASFENFWILKVG